MSKFLSLLFLTTADVAAIAGDASSGSHWCCSRELLLSQKKENEKKHKHAGTRDEWRQSGNNNEMELPEAIAMIDRERIYV